MTVIGVAVDVALAFAVESDESVVHAVPYWLEFGTVDDVSAAACVALKS